MVRGVGVDTVDLGAFAASLAEPGTRFAGAFSALERRQSRDRAEARGAVGSVSAEASVGSSSSLSSAGSSSTRGGASAGSSSAGSSSTGPAAAPDPISLHLAGRWAVKEALIKAWSAALYGQPPPLAPELVRWPEIETVCDAWGRPSVRLSGEVARHVVATVGEGAVWHVSLSHDGDAAVAFVVLEA